MVHVVLLGHGSRDPRHAATTDVLRAAVATAISPVEVSVAFLDLCPPTLAEAVAATPSGSDVVVVPLLFTRAFHARVDVPAALTAAEGARPDLRVRATDVLGSGDAVAAGLLRRVREAGADPTEPGTGIVVVAAGSSDAEARAEVAALAAGLLPSPERVRHAFASGDGPAVEDAVADLARAGVRRIAVARCFVAPGRLADGVVTAAVEAGARHRVEVAVSEVLGDAPELVELVTARVQGSAS